MPMSLEMLCSSLDPQSTSLVFGAGASVPSGAPSGATLSQSLWALVAKSSSQSDDLVETATILERRFGRKAVIEAVREQLKDLQPTGGLLGIPCFPWKQLFTTNFDRLVEAAYKSRGVPLVAMRSNYDLSNKDSIGRTRLYKIHGCITQDRSLGDKPSMILSEDDYESYSQFRKSLFASLQSALLNGDVLVVGQSLKDRHLNDLVKDVLKSKLEGAPGQLYVLVYDKDDLRAPLLEDRGARIIFGGIDQLVDQLAQGTKSAAVSAVVAGEYLSAELVSSVIEVAKTSSLPSNVVRMFNGGSATYPDVRANAVFERSRTSEMVQKLEEGKNPFAVVTGAAGVGKSTMCRQVIIQLEKLGFHAWEQKEDVPFRHEHWLSVEAALKAKGQRGILFVDECTHNLRAVNLLADNLSALATPALRLILSANASQWAPRVKSPNLFKKGTIIELSTLEDSEIRSLVNLVEQNHNISGLVHSSFKALGRGEQLIALRRKASADMFVCLKNIFANESLDTILLREFEQLDSTLQDTYRYVAALEAVGMRVHRHLLIRMLSLPPVQIAGSLAGLTGIIDEYDIDTKLGVYGWRTRHLVIARKVTDYKFSGAEELSKLFELIVDNINPSVDVERNSIANICDVEHGIGRIGDRQARLAIYRRLTNVAPAERIPWHRVVRELLNAEELDDAEYAIREAEDAVGSDAPLKRYKVRLLVLRSQKTSGISSVDRGALLRKAYELASSNLEHHKWDRHSYKTLCDVALLLLEKGLDVHLIEEALVRTRVAAAEICDPEMDRDLQRAEGERARYIH